uniref:Uncharacterized protein n=1 Tax=Kalanchoe fedtschenkoi TaxID=63787 RepID=A0A7N0U889_KALFE
MTAASDEDWAAAAMAEDALVVDVLLRLRQSTRRQARGELVGKLAADLAPAGWGARQPRTSASAAGASGSKSVVVMASECRRKSRERIGRRGRRCSPSTPLSWSGGSGGGGGVDGCEASSPHMTNRSPVSRSKITLAGSEVNGASSSKARKKKTHAELREEEEMLLKERMHLNRELAMLGATVMEQRAENENLKRIKLDLSTQLTRSHQCTAAVAAGGPGDSQSMKESMKAAAHNCVPSALTPRPPNPEAEPDTFLPAQERAKSMLPDLNMMPSELDPSLI